MHRSRLLLASCAVALSASGFSISAQLPLQPVRDAGQGVTPAFEGWYQNDDGSFSLLVGYFNRNLKEVLDVPIGPNNRIEPGGPDQGQPTHFLPRRGWGVFTIKVPKDFGDKRLTWTITANGQTNAVPVGLIKGYQVEPFKEAAQGNEPPRLQFDPKGQTFFGPPSGLAATLSGAVGQPITISGIATDGQANDPDLTPAQLKQPPLTLFLSKYRGPGDITFENERLRPEADGKFSTTATFSAPGEYIVRVQANDRSGDGGGGFQCCWTNAHVRVNVTGGTK
ncbi:MAG TPA: hypothetical protein VMO26_09095 [Vicinamibacterales bacterium]|nr:hypothetical protein [Vicinamibacterales bacterium]